jgi:hypothetical protein
LVGAEQVTNTKTLPNIFEMRPICARIGDQRRDQFCRLPFMGALSLLFCKSATERHDELTIWLYVALAAMAFVIADKEAELIVLELAFTVALCLRQGAALAARAIRKSVNVITAIGVMARNEGRQVQRCAESINHVITATARRRSSESPQACFASLGLSHLCLSSRLLPLPVSIAR